MGHTNVLPRRALLTAGLAAAGGLPLTAAIALAESPVPPPLVDPFRGRAPTASNPHRSHVGARVLQPDAARRSVALSGERVTRMLDWPEMR